MRAFSAKENARFCFAFQEKDICVAKQSAGTGEAGVILGKDSPSAVLLAFCVALFFAVC